jgi:hypothetical protein
LAEEAEMIHRTRKEWIDKARDFALEDEIARRGIKLRRVTAIEFAGPCPQCGGDDRFSINTREQLFNCRGCGGKGRGVIDLVMFIDGIKFNDACEKLAGPAPKLNGRGPARTGTWIYRDAEGKPYLRVQRIDYPDGTKQYPQSRWDGQWVKGKPDGPKLPYRLPELLDSDRTEPVWICEGEKCADAVAAIGLTATSASEGAGKWTADLNEWFRDRIVYVLPDNDEPGRKHAELITRNLSGVAREVRIVELPDLANGEDAFDWISRGGTRDQLDDIGATAPVAAQASTSAHSAQEGGESETGEVDELEKMLAQYSIVLVGGSARIISWKKRRLYVGDCGEHEVPNLIKADSFRLFHRDKFQMVKGPDSKSARQQLTNLFFDQARRYDDLVFAPGAGPAVGNALNLWRGWGVAPKPGNWSRMRDHIRNVIADGVEEHDEYIMRWIAWAVQNPGRQAEVALVIRGGKGVGKGTFGLAMCRIFGPHGLQIADRKHLVGAFNMHLSQCALLFADEAYWPNDKEGEGALKRLITEPTLSIEPKGVDLFSVTNNLHVIISGNDEWIVPASGDERRYAVFNVGGQRYGDRSYFDPLHAEIESGGLAAMLHDLLAMDLAGWHPRTCVPQTDALQAQKAYSRRGVDRLVEIIATEAALPCAHEIYRDIALTTGEGEGKGFYAYAKNLVPDLRFSSSIMIATSLVDQWGCYRWKSGMIRGIKFPSLPQLREAFVQKHGAARWPENDTWN